MLPGKRAQALRKQAIWSDTKSFEQVTAAGFSVPETHYAVRGAAVGFAMAQNA